MNNVTDFFGCKIDATNKLPENFQSIESLIETISVMKPQPSPYSLVRIGGNGDGAYLVPDDIAGIKACFSPGVNNYKYFEDELTEKYNISCHMCDRSSDLDKFTTPIKSGYQTFKKLWLDVDAVDNSISLADWVDELCPDVKDDLLLQIDIEGAEYRNLLHTSEDTLKRFRIIVIEFHGLSMILSPDVFQSVFRPLFQKIDALFTCVHAHPNNCCGDFQIPGTNLNLPNVHELTFLRRDRMAIATNALNPVHIPHPLDISRNVALLAPLFLNEEWSNSGRSYESQIKILKDKLEFQEFHERMISIRDKTLSSSIYKLAQQACRIKESTYEIKKYDDNNDIAFGKTFTLTSSYQGWYKFGTVNKANPFFFHTDFGINESITIDLGKPYCIRMISIKNRLDTCQDRANFLFYTIHDKINRENDIKYPIEVNDDFLNGHLIQCNTAVPAITARYVSIFSLHYTALHFSEVQVFAEL